MAVNSQMPATLFGIGLPPVPPLPQPIQQFLAGDGAITLAQFQTGIGQWVQMLSAGPHAITEPITRVTPTDPLRRYRNQQHPPVDPGIRSGVPSGAWSRRPPGQASRLSRHNTIPTPAHFARR